MNPETFERALAALPRVESVESLPAPLRAAAEQSPELHVLVRERIELDRLLDLPDEIVPSVGSVSRTVARAVATDRAASAPNHLRSRWWIPLSLAATLGIGVAIGTLVADRQDAAPDPALLAQLDLLLEWDWLEEHQDELDLIGTADLIEAAHGLSEAIDSEEGR